MEYQYGFVIYFDILGFRELSTNETESPKKLIDICQKIQELSLQNANTLSKESILIRTHVDAISDSVFIVILPPIPEPNLNEMISNNISYEDIGYTNIATNETHKSLLPAVLDSIFKMINHIQSQLLSHDPPLLVRGGVTYGKVYFSYKNALRLLVGPGITKAAKLEKKKQALASIILDKKIFKPLAGILDKDQREKLFEIPFLKIGKTLYIPMYEEVKNNFNAIKNKPSHKHWSNFVKLTEKHRNISIASNKSKTLIQELNLTEYQEEISSLSTTYNRSKTAYINFCKSIGKAQRK